MIKNKLYQYGDQNGRVPAHLNFGKEVFDKMVENRDIVAMINTGTEESMTYGEFAQMTADIALSLARIGVKKGDVLSICCEKRFEYLPTVLGIMCAGATFSPTDPTYGSYPLLHRLKIVRPKVMFCSLSAYKTHKATFDEADCIEHFILYEDEPRQGAVSFKEFLTESVNIEEFEPAPVNGQEDHVAIVFSSGTTGLPKGVPMTHLNFLLNSQTIVKEDEFKGRGIYNTREFYYTYGLMNTLACMRVTATIIYNPDGGEKEMFEAIQRYKILVLQVAPMIVTELLNSPILDDYDVTSVKYIVSSSTNMSGDAMLAVQNKFPNLELVLQVYGMSEAGSVCNALGKKSKPGSCGVPCHGFVVKVVDTETRQPLGPNQRGEICIKGVSVIEKYMNNVSPDFKDEEGFLKTGDVGYYDDEGYFFILNRIKELIKYNDISIAPAEFEQLLLQNPAVRETCVVGKPHPQHGEAPVAFVVLQPGRSATEEELVDHVNSRVTFRMRLAGGVRFIDQIPRGAGDKPNRKELKQRLLDEDAKANVQQSRRG